MTTSIALVVPVVPATRVSLRHSSIVAIAVLSVSLLTYSRKPTRRFRHSWRALLEKVPTEVDVVAAVVVVAAALLLPVMSVAMEAAAAVAVAVTLASVEAGEVHHRAEISAAETLAAHPAATDLPVGLMAAAVVVVTAAVTATLLDLVVTPGGSGFSLEA